MTTIENNYVIKIKFIRLDFICYKITYYSDNSKYSKKMLKRQKVENNSFTTDYMNMFHIICGFTIEGFIA